MSDYVVFNQDGSYTYSYEGMPQTQLSKSDATQRLSANELYCKRSRPDKNLIREALETLVDEINDNADKLMSSLYCFDCLLPIERRKLIKLNYLSHDCGFVLDSSSSHVSFHNIEEKYAKLRPEDWGMDYIEFDENNG